MLFLAHQLSPALHMLLGVHQMQKLLVLLSLAAFRSASHCTLLFHQLQKPVASGPQATPFLSGVPRLTDDALTHASAQGKVF